jgi:phosphoribosylformylglycinamidine cyclo-ligase
MEIYVPEAVAQDIIAISKSFHVDAQIVGRVEAANTKTDNQ